MRRIYTYSNYRDYLKDFHNFHKATKSSFSWRLMAEKAGINSSGFYPTIVQGKRDLTDKAITKTCVALELDHAEGEFFETLVHFNQAKTLKNKNQFFEKLVGLQNLQNEKSVSENEYDFFSEWYHPAVREIAVSRDFKEDYRALGRMLKPEISAKQASQSVKLLLRLGFLQYDKGVYRQADPILNTSRDLKSHQVMNFQIKMYKMAIEAFDRFGPEDRISNSSSTFALSPKNFSLFQNKLRECRQELLKIARLENNPEDVYQLNINMFPLTKSGPRGKKK